jgi:hypothetical protein
MAISFVYTEFHLKEWHEHAEMRTFLFIPAVLGAWSFTLQKYIISNHVYRYRVFVYRQNQVA